MMTAMPDAEVVEILKEFRQSACTFSLREARDAGKRDKSIEAVSAVRHGRTRRRIPGGADAYSLLTGLVSGALDRIPISIVHAACGASRRGSRVFEARVYLAAIAYASEVA